MDEKREAVAPPAGTTRTYNLLARWRWAIYLVLLATAVALVEAARVPKSTRSRATDEATSTQR